MSHNFNVVDILAKYGLSPREVFEHFATPTGKWPEPMTRNGPAPDHSYTYFERSTLRVLRVDAAGDLGDLLLIEDFSGGPAGPHTRAWMADIYTLGHPNK